MSSESDVELTPPEITEAAKQACINLIPEISKEKYVKAYKSFTDWQREKGTASNTETVFLAYFNELSQKLKSSTLWAQYSMLRTMLNINTTVDIGKYSKLRAFLKRKSDGYRPKKSKIFSTDEVDKSIKNAPDDIYLLDKVLLIMGIMGASRRDELYRMKTTGGRDLDSAAVLIQIPNTKTKVPRKFTITGVFYDIYKKYKDLRPEHVAQNYFFVNYQKGKCTVQRVGLNKIGYTGTRIAKFLKLPNPELYTGHCFRRSSATILIDAGEDITSLKRHGGWKSPTVAESYIDQSMKNKFYVANKIMSSINDSENLPSTSRSYILEHKENTNMSLPCPDASNITFNHCNNITVNIVNN